MPKRAPAHMMAQRERILRAMFECIAENGVEGTSISDICRKAGLSVGALYVHFQNKEEVVAETLRYGSMNPNDLPRDWAALKAMIVDFEDQKGFDITTVVRTRLNLHAECVRPGRLHDVFRPLLERVLMVLANHLQALADEGKIVLKMSAWDTAISVSAFIDGMLWIALATDRPLDDLKPQLSAGLDAFVTAVDNG